MVEMCLPNHSVFYLFFLLKSCVPQGHKCTKEHLIWCSGRPGVEIWGSKGEFALQPTRHAGLYLSAKLEERKHGCVSHEHVR